jgi:maltooligosyltrehalose synthase
MPGEEEDNFTNRVQEYLQKALREAKTHSNWTTPNEEYEGASKNFAVQLLDKSKPFWSSFEKLHTKVSDFGIVNSLAQVTLKYTCPGVPDLYQGTEFWDFSLVDPDNRRLVKYEEREHFLNELERQANEEHENLMKHLWDKRYSAKIKLWLVHQLLKERGENAEVFSSGEYLPLTVEGEYKQNVLAFARKSNDTYYVIAVPLHLASLTEKLKTDLFNIDWKNTTIVLPSGAPPTFDHLFAKTKGQYNSHIEVKEIFKSLPLAVLKLH